MAEYCAKQPNVARKIALDLSLNDVQALCKSKKACHKNICQNNGFWKNKYKRDNPEDDSEPMDDDWKRHYQESLKSLFVIESNDVDMPIELPITRAVSSISCGVAHMGLITTMGNLYMKGSNMNGRLGLPPGTSHVDEFMFIRENVKKIKCGYQTFYIDNNSDAYAAALWLGHFGFTKIAENVFDVDVTEVEMRVRTVLVIDNKMDLYVGPYNKGNKNVLNFQYTASDIKYINHIGYVIDNQNNLYVIKRENENFRLAKTISPINSNVKSKGYTYTLTIDGDLHVSPTVLDKPNIVANEVLIDTNVVNVYEQYRNSLIYTKRNGDVYGRGKVLFDLNIYIDEIFQDFIDSLSEDNWHTLLDDLNNNTFVLDYQLGNTIYHIRGIKDVLNIDDLYDKILELSDRDKFGLLNNLLNYPAFYGNDRLALYREIIIEYSKYSVVISEQAQLAEFLGNEVYVLSTEANFNVPRKFL